MLRTLVATLLVAVPAATVFAQTAADLSDACQQATNMGPELCGCMGDMAEAELEDDQRALLFAILQGDDAQAAELRAGMAPMATVETATFVTDAPVRCASQ